MTLFEKISSIRLYFRVVIWLETRYESSIRVLYLVDVIVTRCISYRTSFYNLEIVGELQ